MDGISLSELDHIKTQDVETLLALKMAEHEILFLSQAMLLREPDPNYVVIDEISRDVTKVTALIETIKVLLDFRKEMRMSEKYNKAIQAVKVQMLAVTKKEPINNAGSFALTLLWQIFKEAIENLEPDDWKEIKNNTDAETEQMFEQLFPVLIADYPKTLTLDD